MKFGDKDIWYFETLILSRYPSIDLEQIKKMSANRVVWMIKQFFEEHKRKKFEEMRLNNG